jgi:phenylalanyl-tRNA synthetase alpha chain
MELQESFAREFSAVGDSQALEALRVKYLGKNGFITQALANPRAGNATPEDLLELRKALNHLKKNAGGDISRRGEELRQAEILAAEQNAPQYDTTLPPRFERGSLAPITLIQREVEAIFERMGFAVEDYPEITDDYHCFEALNIPPFHPARDMQDTFYLENGQVLKTHTSAAQNAIMRKYGAPLRAIFPGRCFRNEAVDATHDNTFFQMEGMMIDADISIANLIYFMKTMLSEVFDRPVKVRLRPGFFPFVEPGFELDINCLICGGEGCPSCGHSGWLELCPCGMMHPNVLRMGGIDTDTYTGFAFGLGLTRLAMMKYGIKDIRDFNSGALKTLRQFVG